MLSAEAPAVQAPAVQAPAAERVLVIGSYPPIPGAAAAASVEAVRAAWGAGGVVTVASPRPSAAHFSVAIVGLLAGRRVGHAYRRTAATKLVLVAERGYPLPVTGPAVGLRQVLTARLLARGLRAFRRRSLVIVGDLGASRAAVSILRGAADQVTLRPATPAPAASGVTVLGPVEMPGRENARRLAGIAARRVLGRRAHTVRLAAARLRQGVSRRA